ncbi:MAG: hydroxymethylpyrimidine/phosphomethylpyrimidine kinase [Candidatus Binatia bacterium]
MSARRRPFVVAIGGFDPSCGAGVVADVRSIEAMGAMPAAVVTAITIQSGTGVRGYAPVPAARVLAQLDELLERLPVAAVKIGQVPSVAVARALARRLADTGLLVVLDPVLVASGGGSLAARGVAGAVLAGLVPLSALVTVNLAEAAVLCGRPVKSIAGMRDAAARIEERGARAVLVKGGHLRGDPVDVLREGGKDLLLRSRRIQGSMHGTGCALASAVAARLACGDDLDKAVRGARDHVRRLLRGAVKAGAGRLRAPSSY